MRLKIFLVEDNPIIREGLVEFFQDLIPSRVVGFASGEKEAASWLRANPDSWELAVVDLFLDEGSGMGVLRALAGRSPNHKVVVLSNYATSQMREICTLAGADAVFDKSEEVELFTQYALNNVRANLSITRH